MAVTRHVTLTRSPLFGSSAPEAFKPSAGRPGATEEKTFPAAEDLLILVYDLASGSRAWVEGQGLRVAINGHFLLPKGGLLRDSEGAALRVPAGGWCARPQASKLSGSLKTFAYYPFRYVW